jgi:hypothetical protein
MKWQNRYAAAGAVLVAIAIVALKRRGTGPPPVETGVAVEAPAEAPNGLLGDLVVHTPNASWARLQRGVGGAAGILPVTLPGIVIGLADLDVQLAAELDGNSPMFGALAGDPAAPGVAFAMKLVDTRRARGLLVEGDTARYVAKPVPGMTLLGPKHSGERRFEIAITENGYLLVATSTTDLARLGPYVTRTLPARPFAGPAAATFEVARSALKASIVPRLESFWKDGKSFLLAQDQRMRAERGRAPDFGDPAAIVAAVDGIVGRRLAILGDLERLRITLEVTEDAAVIVGTLGPTKGAAPDKSGGAARTWVETMKVGDDAAVLALPAASLIALSMRDGEAERSEQSKELEKTLTSAMGPRLKQTEALHEVVEGIVKARDESFALAIGLDDPAGLLLRAPVRDADAANKTARALLDLAQNDPFKELLHVREVRQASEDVAGLGKVNLVTLVRERPRPAGAATTRRGREDAGAVAPRKPPELGVTWLTREDEGPRTFLLGAGAEALVTLRLGARPDRALSAEPSLKRFTTALGSDASTVIVAQPLRLDPARANLPTAPLAIAVGKKDGDAFVRIDIADALLREAARWQMGF